MLSPGAWLRRWPVLCALAAVGGTGRKRGFLDLATQPLSLPDTLDSVPRGLASVAMLTTQRNDDSEMSAQQKLSTDPCPKQLDLVSFPLSLWF